jgi:two-component system, sensor histidine kinase RegB
VLDSLTRIVDRSLIRLRWLSVAAMVLAALASPHLLGPSPLRDILLLYAGAVGLINLAFLITGRLGAAAADAGSTAWWMAPAVQLGFDLLAWGGYVFFSGGATNPLISLLLPLVAIGALVLPPRQAWTLALAAVLIYSGLWRFHVPLQIEDVARAGPLHLFGMWLVFVMSAVLVVGFILQLSARVRLRDGALAAAREQALRDDWLIALGAQAAAAAHALGTPLASLNVLTDDLLDDPRLPDAFAADVRAMKTELRRCKATLGQLSAQAGQTGGEPAPRHPADAWLQRLVQGWRQAHPQIAVAMAQQPLVDAHLVQADSALERAITNLLDNAVRAGARRIRVSAEAALGTLRVEIIDDGGGIPAAALAAFAAREPQAAAGGLGVGLLLGRAAVERRGGSLALAPRTNTAGTLALLQLPLAAEAGHVA